MVAVKAITALFLLAWLTQTGFAAPKVTFKDSYLRYFSGHDLFRLLHQKFPDADLASTQDCRSLTANNRGLVGDQNPVNGEPMYQGPSVAFAKWYVKCVMIAATSELTVSATKPHGFDSFFGKKAMGLISTTPYAAVVEKPDTITWATLSPEIQTEVVANLLHFYIGRGILENESGISKKLLVAVQDKTLSTAAALKQLILFITTQDEFLTY